MRLASDSTLQNGKYRIIRVLGQGGFGITYLAENTFFEKKVAIKEFFPKDFCGRDNTSHLTLGTQNNAETVTRLRDRFLKEAKNIARLDNGGIVSIHDIFEENNTAYYVMDYIEGESLNEMVKRNGPLPEKKALEYIRRIAEALEYIHSNNMTHFDVKPANIVVRNTDDRPILIDFGLSKQYDAKGDATSTLMQGISQGYSPIELYNVGAITSFSPQTDIYSLGATLYFLVAGKVPPSASQIVEEGLSFADNISAPVRLAIRTAMQASRAKRPQSAMAFLEILDSDAVDDEERTRIIDDEDERTRIIEDNKPKDNTNANKTTAGGNGGNGGGNGGGTSTFKGKAGGGNDSNNTVSDISTDIDEEGTSRKSLLKFYLPIMLCVFLIPLLFKLCNRNSSENTSYDPVVIEEAAAPAEEVWYDDSLGMDSIW